LATANDDRPDDASVAPRDESEALARVPVPVQLVWVVLAAFGFIDSVFGGAGASFPWHPIASTSALAWLVFGIIGLVVNHLAKVGLPGGGNFSFRKLQRVEQAVAQSEVSVEALREVLSDYSDLMQNWLQAVNLFTEQLEKYAKTDDDVAEILAQFCLGRMEEAREVIAERGDRTRVSFWWFIQDEGGLKLLFSDDIRDEETLNHVFRPGVGLLGQCYVESRVYNIEDAPSSIYHESIPASPDYHGLLLVPVKSKTDGPVIGVLSVDREKKEAFDENASKVAGALADLIAYAMETGLAFEPS
jgi:GAF domain